MYQTTSLILKFCFVEEIEGLNDLWLVGDNFVSASYREHYMKRNQPWFMRNQFELGIFCNSRFTSNDTNILNWLRTSVINGVNARVKLPKIIVNILE